MAPWLPPDILLRITSYVPDSNTLQSLRLVNHAWSEVATKHLEEWVYLDLQKSTQEACEKTRTGLLSRRRVKTVVINTPDNEYWHRRYRKDRDRIVATHDVIQQYENLRIMVQHKIHWFPNLTRLEYHLRPPSREIAPFPGGPTYQKNWVCDEALGDLVEILRKLTTRSVPKRVLEELSIQCLPVQQGFPLIENEDEMEETPAYLERILKKLRLRTLKLGLVSAEVWQPAGTREVQVFNIDPPNMWLSGTTRTLTTLSITCWGFYTKNIAGAWCRPPFFPELETLELRGCGFTKDTQVDWLERQKKLRSLILDDCAIIDGLVLNDESLTREPHWSVEVVMMKGRQVQFYKTRWSQYFRMLSQLPQLKEFRIGSSRVRQPGEEGPRFESERSKGPPFKQPAAKFLFGLFPDRYLMMSDATAACQWLLRNTPQVRRGTDQLDEADRDALRSLLQKIGQTVDEDATSDHAGYVEDLIGKVKAKDSSKGMWK